MKTIKILKILMEAIVRSGIIIAPVFVFLLVWVLLIGNIALIKIYLNVDLSSGVWGFISIFGSMALAGRFAILTYKTYKYVWRDMRFLLREN